MTKIYLRKDAATKQEGNKKSYMQLLDDWIDEQVIEPLFEAWEIGSKATDEDTDNEVAKETEQTIEVVHKVIREKALESYRNGLKAKADGPRRSGAGEWRRYGAQ